MTRQQRALLLTKRELDALELGALQAVAQAIGISGRGTREELTPLIREQQFKHRAYGEWCRHPNTCFGKGYCPRDPTCAD